MEMLFRGRRWGGWFPYVEERKKERNAETDAEFIALARNAFDIMMRHPSWTLRACLDGEYRAYWHIEDDLENRLGCGGYDPFTALAEADKWYKENMENNQ